MSLVGFQFQNLQISREYVFFPDCSMLYFYYFALVLGNNSFVFSSYLQLKKMTEDIHLILDALASSSLLEVQVAMLF